jgi:uncharacterized protein YdeI (YjbR/CyaY-like superfamily)
MKPTFFASSRDFRAWLEAHHESERQLLVGYYKRGTGKPSISWPESVDEALCFGWIDGVRKSLSEDAYSVRFTPRRATSVWSAINVARAAALESLGRMTPAGRRAFALRTPERTGVYSFERNASARLSPDAERRLRANAAAFAFFDAQPPGYRRTATHWVISAKREATRARRLDQLIRDSAEGRRIGPLARPTDKPAKAAPARAERAAKISSKKKSSRTVLKKKGKKRASARR